MNRTTLIALERANEKLFLQEANITDQRLIARSVVQLLIERDSMIEALLSLARWDSDPTTTSTLAREALARVGVGRPKT